MGRAMPTASMPAQRDSLQLVVTTCYGPDATQLERAHMLGARFGAPVVARAAWPRVFGGEVTHAYVVARAHEEVRDAAGRACFVNEGLLTTKLGEGARHPYIRALTGAPRDDGGVRRTASARAYGGGYDNARAASGAPRTIVDATLGLAQDALHAASVVGCRVIGVEGSALVHALLEEGLARLARAHPAAARIELVHAHAVDALARMDARSADVVVLDPMMSRAKKSAPAFALLRELALGERATPALLAEAARVASQRVVLKLGKGAPLPADAPMAFARHEKGAHVVYWIHDVVAA